MAAAEQVAGEEERRRPKTTEVVVEERVWGLGLRRVNETEIRWGRGAGLVGAVRIYYRPTTCARFSLFLFKNN